MDESTGPKLQVLPPFTSVEAPQSENAPSEQSIPLDPPVAQPPARAKVRVQKISFKKKVKTAAEREADKRLASLRSDLVTDIEKRMKAVAGDTPAPKVVLTFQAFMHFIEIFLPILLFWHISEADLKPKRRKRKKKATARKPKKAAADPVVPSKRKRRMTKKLSAGGTTKKKRSITGTAKKRKRRKPSARKVSNE